MLNANAMFSVQIEICKNCIFEQIEKEIANESPSGCDQLIDALEELSSSRGKSRESSCVMYAGTGGTALVKSTASSSRGHALENPRQVQFASNGTKRPAGPLTRRRGSAEPRAEANRVVVVGSRSSRHTGMQQTRSKIVRRAAKLEQY